jgi:hypothetical protein
MNKDADSIPSGSFVMIASSVEEEDTGKLFVKNEEGSFSFIADLSGATGMKGE